MDNRKKTQAYLTMIESTQDNCYFMWDGLKDALMLDLEAGHVDLLLYLSNKPSHSSAKREILRNVLSEYGNAWPEKTLTILDYFEKNRKNTDTTILLIEVAYHIGNFDRIDRLALENNKLAKSYSVQYICKIWERDNERGYKSLAYLADHIRRLGVPKISVILSCFNISLFILMEGFNNPDAIKNLKDIWVVILDQLLYKDIAEKTHLEWVFKKFRKIVFRLLSRAVWLSVGRILKENAFITFDGKDLEGFFDDEDYHKRNRFTELIKFLDIRWDIHQATPLLKDIIQDSDYASLMLMLIVLSLRGIEVDTEPTSPVTNPAIYYLYDLFKYAVEIQPAKPAIHTLIQVLVSVGKGYRAEAVDIKYLELIEACLSDYFEKHNSMPANGIGELWSGFGYYAQLYYIHDPYMNSAFLKKKIRVAFRNKNNNPNDKFLEWYIKDMNYVSSPGARKIWAMLGALKPVLVEMEKYVNKDFVNQLEDLLVRELAKTSQFYPLEVKSFLQSLDDTKDLYRVIKGRVLVTESYESTGNIFAGRFSWFFRDVFLINPDPYLMNWLISILNELPKSKSFTEWFEKLIIAVIALIYSSDPEEVISEI